MPNYNANPRKNYLRLLVLFPRLRADFWSVPGRNIRLPPLASQPKDGRRSDTGAGCGDTAFPVPCSSGGSGGQGGEGGGRGRCACFLPVLLLFLLRPLGVGGKVEAELEVGAGVGPSSLAREVF